MRCIDFSDHSCPWALNWLPLKLPGTEKRKVLLGVKGQTGNNEKMDGMPTLRANGREKHLTVHMIHGDYSTIREGFFPKEASSGWVTYHVKARGHFWCFIY